MADRKTAEMFFNNGAMACIIMAGVVTTSIFMGNQQSRNPRRAILIAVAFSVMIFIAGRLLTPLGISKIRATPTWSLYSIGAAILAFALLYWLCDVKSWTRWAFFVKAAGENTLTTYLLPDLWYLLTTALGIMLFENNFDAGWAGVLKTVVFTGFMLFQSNVLQANFSGVASKIFVASTNRSAVIRNGSSSDPSCG